MPPHPFQQAAAELLRWEAGRVPDLSACTVLLPHLHAAAPLLAALRSLVDRPVFLPPRLHTLHTLVAEVPAPGPVEHDCQRLAEVHDVLLQAGVCRTQALWAVARELLDLIDELSAEGLQPGEAPQGLLAQVKAAYGSRSNRLLEAESRLVLELWRAMQQGRVNDPVRDRALRLAQAACGAAGPLYTLGLTRLSRLDEGFLAQWAMRHPVRALPWLPALPERRALLEAAWPSDSGVPMPERAAALRQRCPASPLAPHVRLLAAPDLEAQALAAATEVRNWVAQGQERIAIVALDRMAARRLRALLERDRILIEDETGWSLATAAVAHVLDRLFALVQDDCYHRDLLDLLKSPFVYPDLAPAARLEAVAELERAISREGVVSGCHRFASLAGQAARAALPMLARLDAARARLSGPARTLADWQQALLAALTDLGADQAFAADVAGRQLWTLLQALGTQASAHHTRYAFGTWREWLALQLDQGSFRDDSIASPIRLVSPSGARLRDFDAAILLGTDAAHLPPASGGGVFNDRVRTELGLPGTAQRHAELRQAMVDILSHIPRVLAIWQARMEDEPNPVSPWLEVLDGFHRLAWGVSLKLDAAPSGGAETLREGSTSNPPALRATPSPLDKGGGGEAAGGFAACPPPTAMPDTLLDRQVGGAPPDATPALGQAQADTPVAPAATPAWPAPGRLPPQLSANAWQSLVACPYRFFARHVLGLAEEEAVAEEMEKRDYGELVHAILHAFHARHPRLADEAREALVEDLARIGRQVFAPHRDKSYLTLGWELRWARRLPAYVDWALAREALGYRWQAGEVRVTRELALPGGGQVTLHGRVDRIDQGPAGQSVLDYKARSRDSLRRALKRPGEDVQLVFYGLLTGAAEATYVALDDDKVESVAPDTDLARLAALERERLQTTLAALQGGAALPATGADQTCRHCEMRGLCRRDYWAL